MLKADILQWIHTEFAPVELATPDSTILQLLSNTVRYWSTNSAFPVVKMFPASVGTVSVQLTPDYKNVVQVWPSKTPDWVLQNYPLWSLLGITIIDNLTSDLIMLSEAYRNYKYYMGTDFRFYWNKSDDPMTGGTLFLSNLPGPNDYICVVGTKRILQGTVNVNISGTSGTLDFVPVDIKSLILTNGIQTYTDVDGTGVLTSSVVGYSGTINYTTGAWTVTGWSSAPLTGTASYYYEEDIKSDYILDFILYYTRALVRIAEGNTLRKADAIDIKNDGQRLLDEGIAEKTELEEKLCRDGRWLSFCRRI